MSLSIEPGHMLLQTYDTCALVPLVQPARMFYQINRIQQTFHYIVSDTSLELFLFCGYYNQHNYH